MRKHDGIGAAAQSGTDRNGGDIVAGFVKSMSADNAAVVKDRDRRRAGKTRGDLQLHRSPGL